MHGEPPIICLSARKIRGAETQLWHLASQGSEVKHMAQANIKWFREWGAFVAHLEEQKAGKRREFLAGFSGSRPFEGSCACGGHGEFGAPGLYVDPEGWRRCSTCGGRLSFAYRVRVKASKSGARVLYLGWLHEWLPFVRQEMRKQGLDGMGDVGPVREGGCIHGSTGEFGWFVDEDSCCRCRLCGGEM
jgi:hypothetical protein